jgi:hypothetical protein
VVVVRAGPWPGPVVDRQELALVEGSIGLAVPAVDRVLAIGDDAAELSDIAESIWRAMDPGRKVRGIVRTVAAVKTNPRPWYATTSMNSSPT